MMIAALLTCHNRRDKTLDCLRSLYAQIVASPFELRTFLVDDGSSDATAEAVASAFPDVIVIQGSGNLFWCGGMRLAWTHAAQHDPDYYLLVNDDTFIYPTAVAHLLELLNSPGDLRIAVGATVDPNTGRQTYGGWRRADRKAPVAVSGQVERCDTFNANCVLVTRAVFRRIGMFHTAYTHAMGDFDYGFLANRAGIEIVQAPEFCGVCGSNSATGTWRDSSLSRVDRFRRMQHVKGLPWREWLEYTYRNEGVLWPYRFISPFLRILVGR